MKLGWILLGLLLLLIASVSFVIVLLVQGMFTSASMLRLLWFLILVVLVLGGIIAWLAGGLPTKGKVERGRMIS